MRKIIVDPILLESKSQRINELNEQYVQLYQKFNNDVDLLEGAWVGKDNQAFTNQIKGFNNDFKQINMIITQYAHFLNSSAKAYRDTQNELICQVKSLQN